MPATTPPGSGPARPGPPRTGGRARVPRPGAAGADRAAGRAAVPGAPGPTRNGPPTGGRYGGGPVLPGEPARRGPRPRWGRIAAVVIAALVVFALLGVAGTWIYAGKLDRDLARTDPFSQVTGGRPVKTVEGTVNILLVGSDSRDPDAPVDRAGRWRADTIILLHIPASHDQAYLVSIPRDLYVRIPESAGAGCDTGDRAKINAAFAFGGLPLAVRTVECFTDIRIDHVLAIDFAGFKEITDALGGVDLYVEQDTTSIHKPFRRFKKGVNHMNGAEALDWIRQRKQFPEGDFARMRHQQEFLRALMDKAASSDTLTNPAKLTSFLNSTTDAVTVDQDFSLVDMAVQFRKLRGEDLRFLVNPHRGSETINGESVVVSDREKALAMYQAIANDTMADWVTANASPRPENGS